ncbi:MAG: tetratricopeptide repeat protein [Candidatus Melainabacteria bacterium]|nr:tetratricopeptide repeat protein [Candidatus Melainabacteria bacterium]
MGKVKLSTSLTSLLMSINLCLAGIACIPAWGQGTGGSVKQKLSALEQRLFFKTYEDADENVRLKKIERRVFGEEMEGSIPERLEKVSTAIGPQRQPDGTVPGAAQRPIAPPPAASPKEHAPSADYEAEDAIEKAKLAVMAAKNAELQRLLGEGVGLWRNRRASQATEKFEQVIRLDPNNAEAHFSMGIIYEAAGNFAEALSSYKKASSSRPENKDYKNAIADVEKKAHSKEKADGLSGELKLMAEDAAGAFKRGEYMSALDLYKQFEAKAPPLAHIKYNIGTTYLMMKNYQMALEYYRQAKKLKPSEPKYVQAVQQLEGNLKRDAAERKQAEKQSLSAYEEQEKKRNPAFKAGNSGSNKFAQLGSQPSAAKGQEFMNSAGLIGKSGRDGVVIVAVGIASRATRAGILQGDLIKAVDGVIIKSTSDLNSAIESKMGQPIQLTVQRGNQLGQVRF